MNQLDAVALQVLQVAENVGLLEAIDERPWDLPGLCEHLRVPERGLRPVVALLCSLGFVTEAEDQFELAEAGRDFLQERWPREKEEFVVPSAWSKLEMAVREGSCPSQGIESDSDAGQFFGNVVDTLFFFHNKSALDLAEHLPQSCSRALDLGAGSAVWSLGLCRNRDDCQVVAVDREEVLDKVTRKFVADHDCLSRYEFRAGSYHDVELEDNFYDLVYLGHIVHSEGWEASRSLLQRCHQCCRSGGLLVVSEWLASEPRGLDYQANLFDLNMLMFTEYGLVFTATELEDLVQEAGFRNPRWHKGPGQYPILIASK